MIVPPASLLALLSPLAAGHHAPFDAGLGWWEWAIAGVAAAASVWVLWLSVRYTLHPGEEGADHVKRSIFDDADRSIDAAAGGRGGTLGTGSP